jgi:hypothetical protein
MVRRIGYEPGLAEIDVPAEGAIVRICIDAEPEPLAPMITSISRGGISGTIADANFRFLAGADVQVIGTGKTATTDSAGAFFVDVRPGTYAMMVMKKGFGTRIIGVTVPKDSGRKVALWLKPMDAGTARQMGWAMDSLHWRFALLGTGHNLFSSEDLMNTSRDITQVVAQRAVQRISENCEAIVNGMGTQPLWSIDKEEVELLEVYPRMAYSPRGQRSMLSRAKPIASQQANRSACGAEIYVWLKR